jgi:hypothetical protein
LKVILANIKDHPGRRNDLQRTSREPERPPKPHRAPE